MNDHSTTGRIADRLREVADRLDRLADKASGELPSREIPALLDVLAELELRLDSVDGDASSKAKKGGPSAQNHPAQRSMFDESPPEMILIWGDGSCAPNPGPGGWGAIIERYGRREELSGSSPDSTNNIMELTAVIEALNHTAPGVHAHVVTDSQYVKNGITRWIIGWKRKGWRKADGKPVLNQELWRALDDLCAQREVTWGWVRGHSGHAENERCDELANQARLALQEQQSPAPAG